MKQPTEVQNKTETEKRVSQSSSSSEDKAKENAAKIPATPNTADPVSSRKSQRKVTKPKRPDNNTNHVAPANRVWPWVTLNIVLISIVAGLSYLAWDQWQGFKTAQALQLDTAISDLNNTSVELESRINQNMQSQLQQLLAINAKQNKQIAEQQIEIAENAGRNQQQWTLAEAQFLTRMAGRKMWLEQDVSTAIALLKSADNVISDTDTPEYIRIREAIAKDISALKALAVIDIPNLAMRLSAMHADVSNLPFAEPETFYSAPEDEVSNDISQWRRNLQIFWGSVKENFISIERVDQPIAPFVNQKLQVLKRSELSLQLTIAQSALLQRQQDYFEIAINRGIALLSFFDYNAASVVAMKQELSELSSIQITASTPNELKTLPVLRSYLESAPQTSTVNQD